MTKIQFNDDDEIKKALLGYGVQFFRNRAGYIPQNAPDELCGLIKCEWIIIHRTLVNWNGRLRVIGYEPILPEDEIIGTIHVLWGKAAICYECAHEFNRQTDNELMYVICWLADEYCELCGKWEEGIPF